MEKHDFIVLTLCAPLASWGAPTLGPVRPCTVAPTKSGITGFLAAVLGIRRTDQVVLDRLAADYGFGCAVLRQGTPLIDYHTMRRDDDVPNAFQTWRHYRTDYLAIVCLWRRSESPLYSPDELVQFCREPVFAPYLGRRTCTLALPPLPLRQILPDTEVVQRANTGIEAIQREIKRLQSFFNEGQLSDSNELTDGIRYFWEEDVPMGIDPLTRTERHDYPLSNMRRQFVSRVECEAQV